MWRIQLYTMNEYAALMIGDNSRENCESNFVKSYRNQRAKPKMLTEVTHAGLAP